MSTGRIGQFSDALPHFHIAKVALELRPVPPSSTRLRCVVSHREAAPAALLLRQRGRQAPAVRHIDEGGRGVTGSWKVPICTEQRDRKDATRSNTGSTSSLHPSTTPRFAGGC